MILLRLQAEAEQTVKDMVSDNDENLSQKQLQYEITWYTKIDERPMHGSSQTFNRTRAFSYED